MIGEVTLQKVLCDFSWSFSQSKRLNKIKLGIIFFLDRLIYFTTTPFCHKIGTSSVARSLIVFCRKVNFLS